MDRKRDISDGRKALYYFGVLLMVCGFLLFLGNMYNATSAGINADGVAMGKTALLAMGIMIVGGILSGIGKCGAAGSGIILDPKQAREDLEPWSRMGGGMLGDAIDESGVLDKFSRNTKPEFGSESADFAEKLRKLHKLHVEGIISTDEYTEAKAEILQHLG